jgi:hypothetical protein
MMTPCNKAEWRLMPPGMELRIIGFPARQLDKSMDNLLHMKHPRLDLGFNTA